MAGNLAVNLLIRARDEASGVFSSLQSHVGAVAGAIAGYLGVSFFKDAVADAREFEKQMDTVAAVSGSTGQELGLLEQAAKDMGASTEFNSLQAAQALEELGRAGLSAEQQIQALPDVLNLATANNLSLADSAGYVVTSIKGMGLEVGDSGRVVDVLTAASASAFTSVEKLGSGLSNVAPIAASMGVSIEDTVSMLSLMQNANIDAAGSGTALKGMMLQFQDPASKFNKELEKLGIETDNFTEAIRLLAAKGEDGKQAILALGTEAGPGLVAMLGQGIPKLNELKQTLDDSAGAAKGTADQMRNNLDGAMAGLGSVWDAIKLQLAQPILEPLTESVTSLTGLLSGFLQSGTIGQIGTDLSNAFGSAVKSIGQLYDELKNSGALEGFKTAFSGAFDAVGGLLGTLKQAFVDLFGLVSDPSSPQIFSQTFVTVLTKVVDIVTVLVNAFTTGLATIESAFFGLSGVVASILDNIFAGIAKVESGLAAITFGDVSKAWQAAADESTRISESFATSAQVNFSKASNAFDTATESAIKTSDAISQLGNNRSIEPIADQAKKVADEVGLTADQVAALGEGVEVLDGKVVNMAASTDKAADSIEQVGNSAESAKTKVKGFSGEIDQSTESTDQLIQQLDNLEAAQRASQRENIVEEGTFEQRQAERAERSAGGFNGRRPDEFRDREFSAQQQQQIAELTAANFDRFGRELTETLHQLMRRPAELQQKDGFNKSIDFLLDKYLKEQQTEARNSRDQSTDNTQTLASGQQETNALLKSMATKLADQKPPIVQIDGREIAARIKQAGMNSR